MELPLSFPRAKRNGYPGNINTRLQKTLSGIYVYRVHTKFYLRKETIGRKGSEEKCDYDYYVFQDKFSRSDK